ncbi:MAG: group II intron reverse transcriptase/maturase [Gemmatimonadetes bacterium]|nr:group II intron reverse transcriptase/maturase [Gemmatimonadota bacterium]MYF93268.1 group II intron reverse transcriptase/maturase [Gemmatimonadota bacterium]
MITDTRLTGSEKVRRLQTVLHAKAKESADHRFHALADKVWRMDFLLEAWKLVRRNGGSAGVDGETITDVKQRGVEGWLQELSQDLREGTYTPKAVRQVLIPKKQPGKFRPLGIPCLRDRVAQTSTMMVLSPIFEADLQPEQYGYREGRSAQDAVKRIHHLLNRGHHEVVDADLSNYFGEIPHAELMKSLARRISDGRMLRLIKAWMEMPVVEEDKTGGKRRTNRARRERKGMPQGSPISPLLSNIYMRRFILGWKLLGYARQFGAEIVCYADDFCVLGRASAAEMLLVITRLMDRLKLPINAQKTRCLRCPEEVFEFLGYRIGWNYRPKTGTRYIGTRPSKGSVQSICRRISEQTDSRFGLMDAEEMVRRLNWILSGWANYFTLGQVSPAYRAIDRHATRRLRQWFCRKHRMKSRKHVRFSDARLRETYGLQYLAPKTKDFPWAKA